MKKILTIAGKNGFFLLAVVLLPALIIVAVKSHQYSQAHMASLESAIEV